MSKSHYTAYEAANLIFLKATKDTAPRYIRLLYLSGELVTSVKINGSWYITDDDVQRIKDKIMSGEIKIVLADSRKPKKKKQWAKS